MVVVVVEMIRWKWVLPSGDVVVETTVAIKVRVAVVEGIGGSGVMVEGGGGGGGGRW